MDTATDRPPSRRRPPAAVGCLSAVVVLLALGTAALAAASSSAYIRFEITPQIEKLRAELEGKLQLQRERGQADELLREVCLHVRMQRAERGHFPRRQSRSLPDDPWGTPLEYERIHAQHARVRSAGPDRLFGTGDDLEEVIE